MSINRDKTEVKYSSGVCCSGREVGVVKWAHRTRMGYRYVGGGAGSEERGTPEQLPPHDIGRQRPLLNGEVLQGHRPDRDSGN